MSLYVITCYFNVFNFQNRLRNYIRFRDAMRRQGVPLMTVQGLLPGQSGVSDDPGDMTVRLEAVLWHKERLINLALRRLPGDCSAFAWVDCDVIFEDDDWLVTTSRLLSTYRVVQLFSDAILLDQGGAVPPNGTGRVRSFAARFAEDKTVQWRSGQEHGPTGFAWAARSEFLRTVGLFDKCIAGGADHVMAHAFAGGGEVPCLHRSLGSNTPLRRAYEAWRASIQTSGSDVLGVRPGTIVHLWHGSWTNRRYLVRNARLIELGYDPRTDLDCAPDGSWRWRDPKSAVARFVADYMASRSEDGGATGRLDAERS
jgi:hypothetical protein